MRAVALLLALSFGAWVGAAHGQTPRSDSVVAQGTTEEFEAPTSPTTTSPAALIFDINATSGPSGENAGGHVALDLSLGVHWDGQVTAATSASGSRTRASAWRSWSAAPSSDAGSDVTATAGPTSLFTVLRAQVSDVVVDVAVLCRGLGERGSLCRGPLLGLPCQHCSDVDAWRAHAVEAVCLIPAEALGLRLGVSLEELGDRVLVDARANLIPAPRAAAESPVRTA